MEPIFGFALYIAACVIVSIVARKRGRSALGFFLVPMVLGMPVAMFVNAAGGGHTGAGFAAFVVPLITLITAASTKSSEQLAVHRGDHGAYRKCPFCAESVRKEAIKCRHCGSAIDPVGRS